MIFYTYLWLREDGTPYYAGKGSGRRAFATCHNVHRPKDISRVLMQEFLSEADALVAEQILIACYGRKNNGTGCLRNLTDGGEGVSGMAHSDAAKRKIGVPKLGVPRTASVRHKISESHKGLIVWNKGLKGSQIAWNKGLRGAQTAWNKGKAMSAEFRANASKRPRDAKGRFYARVPCSGVEPQS